jgi:UDP:flavonoid glycosyltransferase YjiC (YdhE family)
MKVLFTHQSGLGHWHPLVPLARAIEAAGHAVAFATSPDLCPTIEEKGFRSFPVGVDDTGEQARFREENANVDPRARAEMMLTRFFAGTRAENALPDLLKVIPAWPADVVVHDSVEFAGCIAAERHAVPHAMFQLTAPRNFVLASLDVPFKRLCASVGLYPENVSDILFRYLLLTPRPQILWDPLVPMPPVTHSFCYEGFSSSGDEQLPAWFAALDDRPTVYSTLGTVQNRVTAALTAILEGLRDEPVNLILTIGRNRDPEEFGDQPPNVHIERYVPQDLLLGRCDLVVSHAGSGTIMDALSHGLPMVLLPLGADQPENARICADLGAALVIEPGEQTAEAIRDAARQVLTNPSYRRNAQRIRDEIQALPGLEYPVALLEKLATDRTPLVAQPLAP